MPIYLWSDKILCSKRVAHVHCVAIDDLVIYTPLKNDITALWSCSGKADASLLGQDVVASLLSLCMAKWLCKWRRGWLYVRSNTKNAKSLLNLALRYLPPLENVQSSDFLFPGPTCMPNVCNHSLTGDYTHTRKYHADTQLTADVPGFWKVPGRPKLHCIAGG